MVERDRNGPSAMRLALQARQQRLQQRINEMRDEVRRFHRACDDVFGIGDRANVRTPDRPSR
jgi:hypothetical protein